MYKIMLMLLLYMPCLIVDLASQAYEVQVPIEESEDPCVSTGGIVAFVCRATNPSGDMLWNRVRPGTTDLLLASNGITLVSDYDVIFNDSSSEWSSTLIVDQDVTDRNNGIYSCNVAGIFSGQSTLYEQDTSCTSSGCTDFDICSYVTVNGHNLDCTDPCGGLTIAPGPLLSEIDLQLNSQQIGVNVTIFLNGKTSKSEAKTWDCAEPFSPLSVDDELSAGDILTITVTTDHPSLIEEYDVIRDCPIPEPDKDNCEIICIIIIICVCGGTIIVVIIIIVKRKELKKRCCWVYCPPWSYHCCKPDECPPPKRPNDKVHPSAQA